MSEKLNTIQQLEDCITFIAKIVPAGSKTAFAGLLDGMLKVKVTAPPEKGKANQALIQFLTKKLGIKKNCISIISGKTSPVKQIKITGICAEEFLNKLNL